MLGVKNGVVRSKVEVEVDAMHLFFNQEGARLDCTSDVSDVW